MGPDHNFGRLGDAVKIGISPAKEKTVQKNVHGIKRKVGNHAIAGWQRKKGDGRILVSTMSMFADRGHGGFTGENLCGPGITVTEGAPGGLLLTLEGKRILAGKVFPPERLIVIAREIVWRA